MREHTPLTKAAIFKILYDFHVQDQPFSSFSSTIANLVMQELEYNVIAGLGFVLIFYKRYVDDCTLCIPKIELKDIHFQFNLYHPRLQCTIEEENRTINLLDITLRHNEEGNNDWFRKSV